MQQVLHFKFMCINLEAKKHGSEMPTNTQKLMWQSCWCLGLKLNKFFPPQSYYWRWQLALKLTVTLNFQSSC